MQSDRRIIRAKAKETAPFGWVPRPTFQAAFFGDSMAQTQAVPLVDPRPLAPRSKRRALIEIAIAYGLILTVMWTPRPWQQCALVGRAVVAVLTMVGLSFESLSAMGLRRGKLLPFAVGRGTGAGVERPGHTAGRRNAYTAHAGQSHSVCQKLLGLCDLGRRATVSAAMLLSLAAAALDPGPQERGMGRGRALCHRALAQSFAHGDDGDLGLTACLLYLRYRNLYPLMIAHAIFGIAIAITVPGPVDHNMRVGLGYLTYNRHMHAHGFHRTSL